MKHSHKHLIATCTSMAALCIALAGCNQESPRQTGNDSAAASLPPARSTAAPAPSASIASPAGPEMLSTVGLYDGAPLTSVNAHGGSFAIQNVDGVDTLTLNGKAARYTPAGLDAPEPVAANSGISLVGVFELPQESVAWVVIIGGAACSGTHVLVGARSGLALPGQEIPGCDDRGTMRKKGDKITFEAGGSAGSYQDGMVTITSKPAAS